jgi:NRPS condensation-like uncharacterized protein
MRALAIQCAQERHVLLLTFHHIAVDGRSVGVFVNDLLEYYDRLS